MALCKFTKWECVEKWKHCKALHDGTKRRKCSFCRDGDLSIRAILPERTCNCTTEGLRSRTKSTCTVAYIEENEALTGNSIFKLTSPDCGRRERARKRKNIVRCAGEEYGEFFWRLFISHPSATYHFFDYDPASLGNKNNARKTVKL